MKKEIRDAFLVHFKWSVLQFAKGDRTDAKAYRDFNVPKSTFYAWKRAFDKEGKADRTDADISKVQEETGEAHSESTILILFDVVNKIFVCYS